MKPRFQQRYWWRLMAVSLVLIGAGRVLAFGSEPSPIPRSELMVKQFNRVEADITLLGKLVLRSLSPLFAELHIREFHGNPKRVAILAALWDRLPGLANTRLDINDLALKETDITVLPGKVQFQAGEVRVPEGGIQALSGYFEQDGGLWWLQSKSLSVVLPRSPTSEARLSPDMGFKTLSANGTPKLGRVEIEEPYVRGGYAKRLKATGKMPDHSKAKAAGSLSRPETTLDLTLEDIGLTSTPTPQPGLKPFRDIWRLAHKEPAPPTFDHLILQSRASYGDVVFDSIELIGDGVEAAGRGLLKIPSHGPLQLQLNLTVKVGRGEEIPFERNYLLDP
ncbi:MAG: hypothetical protein HQL52_09230 [Magnetococcales bacterium]|nr:hypothetical protein [Magnetococcales bacterium]